MKSLKDKISQSVGSCTLSAVNPGALHAKYANDGPEVEF